MTEVYEQLIKKYGEVVKNGKVFIDKPHVIVPMSPALDVILGGGIPEGSLVILTGNPKWGKSLSSLHLCGNAQKLGKKIYYLNIEGRLKSRDLKGIQNLNAELVTIIGSEKGSVLSGEKYLRIAEDIIKDDPGSVIVLDSISQLCPEKELAADVGDTGRNPTALLMASFCRKISNILPVNGNIVICITHLIANTSGYGNPLAESGGRKIAYAVDVKLRAKALEKWKINTAKGEVQIGQIVTWETESTAIIAPGRQCQSYIRYGVGIDESAEIVSLATNLGMIKKAGAWYNILDPITHQPVAKCQGEFNTILELEKHPEFLTKLKNEIKTSLIG